MGLLNKITGGADKSTLHNGLPGRGLILGVTMSGTTIQSGNGLVQRKCTFELEVSIDNTPPYQTTCVQRIPELYLPQINAGSTVLAVKVDPDDHSKVVLDLDNEPPTVQMAATPGKATAADIIANGRPAKGVIIESLPLGKKSPTGLDMYAFSLTVAEEGQPIRQVQVGNPTPTDAIPLLFNGSHVPLKLGNDPHEVVIDWAEALAHPDI